MPDAELLDLAARGRLRDPEVRRAQVERMLSSPRRRRSPNNFTGQWLKLREIAENEPDLALYPEFDALLEYSMVEETRRFFDEVLRRDLSVMEFVDSDWSMLNDRLAEHYGIPGVSGCAFPPRHAAGGFGPRRPAHAGQRPQGDRQWDDHVAGRARRVGHRELARHPRPAPAAGARRGARLDGRDDPSSAARQTSQRRFVRQLPQQDRSPGLRTGELRRHRRLARAVSHPDRRGARPRSAQEGGMAGHVQAAACPWIRPGRCRPGRRSGTFASSRRCSSATPSAIARCIAEKLLTYGLGRGLGFSDRADRRGDRRADQAAAIRLAARSSRKLRPARPLPDPS